MPTRNVNHVKSYFPKQNLPISGLLVLSLKTPMMPCGPASLTSGILKNFEKKMAASNKPTDTRSELAELLKKRAEIAVSIVKMYGYPFSIQ